MKSFDRFIQEKNLPTDTNSAVFRAFSSSNLWIPMTPKMIKRLEEFKDMMAIHLTQYKSAARLVELQNTNTAVSVTFDYDGEFLDVGVEDIHHTDVACILRGQMGIVALNDVYTEYDRQGNRWVESNRMLIDAKSERLKRILRSIQKEWSDTRAQMLRDFILDATENRHEQFWLKFFGFKDPKSLEQYYKLHEADNAEDYTQKRISGRYPDINFLDVIRSSQNPKLIEKYMAIFMNMTIAIFNRIEKLVKEDMVMKLQKTGQGSSGLYSEATMSRFTIETMVFKGEANPGVAYDSQRKYNIMKYKSLLASRGIAIIECDGDYHLFRQQVSEITRDEIIPHNQKVVRDLS